MAYNALPPWDVASSWVHRPVARWNPSSQKAPLGMLRWPRQHKKNKNIYGKITSHHATIHQIYPLLFVEHTDHLWKHPVFQYLQLPFDVYINYECTPLVMMSIIGVRPDSGTRCTVVSERKWMKQHILPRKLTAGTHKLVVCRCFSKAPRIYFVGSMGSFKV